MNHRSSTGVLGIVSTLTFALLVSISGCASEPQKEPVANDTGSLASGGCGPVSFTGEGWSESKEKAHSLATDEARRTCRETPMFCGVDCDGAPISDEKCYGTGIEGQDGETAISWYCSVTISASSPPKKCDVAVRCAPGWTSADTDGDGCPDSCVQTRKSDS